MDDEQFMRLALELARKGEGTVNPNPLVGSVVVKDGTIVGQGHHQAFGGPHAEAVALEQARENAHGATLYVSLEPCCYRGKTPPCTMPNKAWSGRFLAFRQRSAQAWVRSMAT